MEQLSNLKPREISATVSQFVFRFRVFASWVELYTRQRDAKNTEERLRLRMSLLSSVCIVVFDIAVGVCIAMLVMHHPRAIFSPLERAYVYLNHGMLQSVVSWLMGSPVGLQMNRNLVLFMGTITLTMVSYWDALISVFIYPVGESLGIEYIIAITSIFGISFLLSVLIDLTSILFFHVFFVYVGTTRLWSLTTQIISSLIHLFQGKKYNILKHRVDKHEFDIEQLILGTVFLAIVLFLTPTVFVFYASFVFLWLAVLLLQFALRAGISFFSFFPIYLWILADSIPFRLAMMPAAATTDSAPKADDVTVVVFEHVAMPLPRSVLMTEFFKVLVHSIPLGESLGNTVRSFSRGTALVFPRYAQHEQADMTNAHSDVVNFGPHYGKLLKKISAFQLHQKVD
jgi:phosphatidylinositol glycan class Q protein